METIYRITGQLWGRFISWMKDEKNQLRFILVCFVITLIEIGFEHKIQNKFILENKFYNVIWLIGMFVSFLLTCIFVILFFYYLFMSR